MNKQASLTPDMTQILSHCGTELPLSGEYNTYHQPGTYLCRQCGIALFRSTDKFSSECGWPSFDDSITNAVKKSLDPDGIRTEITCKHCQGHLGHAFTDEGYTPKNIRYCVNSLSLDFVTNEHITETEEAIVAGGCFWGIEHYFLQESGVLKTEVGYTGGKTNYPTYQSVCSGNTRHFEATRIVYDPKQISYQQIIKLFFEIHDPTQANGQGADIGTQYHSAVFYFNEEQKKITEDLMHYLEKKGNTITTQVLPATVFWPAEKDHQQYYLKHKQDTVCHRRTPRFPKEEL